MTWPANVLTLYPEMFPGPLGASLAGRALRGGIWSLETVQIRDFATDKHRSVDDTPAGGGAGMVMRADVLAAAVDHALAKAAQAPLLAMLLLGQLGLEDARTLIARRPPNGWPRIDDFWAEPAVRGFNAAPDVRAQTVIKTRWFRLRLDVELDGAQLTEIALIDAGSNPARLVSRNWGQD